MRQYSWWMIVIALVLTIYSCSAYASEAGITTGSSAGTYYAIAKDISKTCTNNSYIVHESNGSISNIGKLLGSNTDIFGIVQYDALLLKNIQDPSKMKNIMMVMPLYGEEIHLITRIGGGVNSLEDLRGKRVVIGKENSGTWVTGQIIKIKTNIKFVDVLADPKASLKDLANGKVDAVLYVAGKPIQALVDLGKDGDGVFKLVSIKHPAIDTFYTPSDIPEGSYAWQAEAVKTLAVRSVLATYNYKSAEKQDMVNDLTSCIVNNLSKLQEEGHPKWREVDPQSYRDLKWPIHNISERVLNGR